MNTALWPAGSRASLVLPSRWRHGRPRVRQIERSSERIAMVARQPSNHCRFLEPLPCWRFLASDHFGAGCETGATAPRWNASGLISQALGQTKTIHLIRSKASQPDLAHALAQPAQRVELVTGEIQRAGHRDDPQPRPAWRRARGDGPRQRKVSLRTKLSQSQSREDCSSLLAIPASSSGVAAWQILSKTALDRPVRNHEFSFICLCSQSAACGTRERCRPLPRPKLSGRLLAGEFFLCSPRSSPLQLSTTAFAPCCLRGGEVF